MVICPKCGYEWQTRSMADMICCPSCQRKFERPAQAVVVLARKVPLSDRCDVCGQAFVFLNCCKVDGSPAFICDNCLTPGGFP